MKKIIASSLIAFMLVGATTASAGSFSRSSPVRVSMPKITAPKVSTPAPKINLAKPDAPSVSAPSPKINLTKKPDSPPIINQPTASSGYTAQPSTTTVYRSNNTTNTSSGSSIMPFVGGMAVGALATTALSSTASEKSTSEVVSNEVDTKDNVSKDTVVSETTKVDNNVIAVQENDSYPRYNAKYPLLTVCTEEQLDMALKWQKDCMNNVKDMEIETRTYCPVLSYFRYCKQATVDEVEGLNPVKPTYKNVYLKP